MLVPRRKGGLKDVALAAVGTLLVLAAYEFWQRHEQAPIARPTPAPKTATQEPAKPAEKLVEPAAKPAAPAASADLVSVARGALGPDGEVLAYGDFAAGAGRQILAVQRLPSGRAPGGAGTTPAASAQEQENAVEVIRVSILVDDQGTWKEAFRADEHLKNRRGYLPGAPVAPVTAWHLVFSRTAAEGFRLEFTPASLPPGRKPPVVYAAWNAKRREYDAVKAWGKGFLEPEPTVGNAPVRINP